MSSIGIDAETGRVLYGWAHVVQSIRKILTTEIGERVHRRWFGSGIPSKIDRPQNLENIVDIYMDVAEALEPRLVEGHQAGEPRFALRIVRAQPGPDGHLTLTLYGTYYPRGHLGDFSVADDNARANFLLESVV